MVEVRQKIHSWLSPTQPVGYFSNDRQLLYSTEDMLYLKKVHANITVQQRTYMCRHII